MTLLDSGAMGLTLAERNAKIAEFAANNPCITLEDIGRHYNITRERVRQILMKQGVHKESASDARARLAPKPLCIECGEPVSPKNKRQRHQTCVPKVTFICDFCGQSYQRNAAWVSWKLQNDSRYRFHKNMCSRDTCPGQYQEVPCTYCGKPIVLDVSKRAQKRRGQKDFFCSNSHSSLYKAGWLSLDMSDPP